LSPPADKQVAGHGLLVDSKVLDLWARIRQRRIDFGDWP
jgi:hypothetical protein